MVYKIRPTQLNAALVDVVADGDPLRLAAKMAKTLGENTSWFWDQIPWVAVLLDFAGLTLGAWHFVQRSHRANPSLESESMIGPILCPRIPTSPYV